MTAISPDTIDLSYPCQDLARPVYKAQFTITVGFPRSSSRGKGGFGTRQVRGWFCSSQFRFQEERLCDEKIITGLHIIDIYCTTCDMLYWRMNKVRIRTLYWGWMSSMVSGRGEQKRFKGRNWRRDKKLLKKAPMGDRTGGGGGGSKIGKFMKQKRPNQRLTTHKDW